MSHSKNSTSQPAAPEMLLGVVRELIAELHPRQADQITVSLDSSLDRDLGLDSLSRVELLARIEHCFDRALPEQILATAETPRDLLRAIKSAGLRPEDRSGWETAAEKLAAATDTPPDGITTLVDALKWHAARHPDRPHIRLYDDATEGEVITYLDLWDTAGRIGAALQHFGLAPGETVLIMLPTGKEYFYSFFGVLLAGGVPVPVYPPGRIKQIAEHLERHTAIAANCLARVMITMPEAKQFAHLMHQKVPPLKRVATFGDLIDESKEHTLRIPARDGAETAFLQYTSGSTGLPKGVVLSHANLLANIRAMGQAIRITADDVFVSWLPLYHDMGLIGAWLGSLYYASPLVIMSPLTFIARPLRWLQAIHRYRGTLSAAPNFAYELCLRRIDAGDIEKLDLGSWRCAFNGAEAVSPAIVEGFTERFRKYGFAPQAMMPVYGLAESSVGLAFPPLGRGVRIDRVSRRRLMDSGRAESAAEGETDALRFVSSGYPLPGHQIRIVDSADRELPERSEGRLQFQGPSSTEGYFRNPEKTAELFHGQWLDSGDRAYIAEGEIHITGRNKDIIIRGGRNIYPEEIEEAVGGIEGLRKGNIAVFGSTTPESATERLIILAETRKRDPDSQQSLRIAVNTLVTDLCGSPPDEVVLAPPNTVPKTSSGKIRRAASRRVYEQGEIGKARQAVWVQIARFSLSAVRPKMGDFIRSLRAGGFALYSWTLFLLATPIAWLLVTLLPRESWRWRSLRAIIALLRRCTMITVRVKGVENIPPEGSGAVLVANHASYLDSIMLALILPGPVSFVAKAELARNPFARVFLKRIGTRFVERFSHQKGVEDVQALLAGIDQGRSLFFFAEGTFTRMPGLLPFRLGAFETAVNAHIPVVPIALRGTRSMLRAGSWFPRHGTIIVEIGPRIDPDSFQDTNQGDSWKKAVRLRDYVRSWILGHCGEPDLEHERPLLTIEQKKT